jgi:O-antigen/teichoic acid export membrane protein
MQEYRIEPTAEPDRRERRPPAGWLFVGNLDGETEAMLRTLLRIGKEWGGRAAFGVVDQGVRSGANFILNIYLARCLPTSEYGAFSVAFVIFLFLAGFHNAFVLEPMIVLGPGRYRENLPSYLRSLLWTHWILSGCMALAAALAAWLLTGTDLKTALLGLAIALPFILFHWTLNRACYLEARTQQAALSSAVYAAILFAGAALLERQGMLGPLGAFLALGISSLIAGLFIWKRSGVSCFQLPAPALHGTQLREVFREHWVYGRWMAALAALSLGTTYIHTLVLAGLLGLEAAGILKAMFNPVQPVAQIITAMSVLALPVLSHDFGVDHTTKVFKKGFLITGVLTALACAYELVLLGFHHPLERFLYGGKFAEYSWLLPLLGTVPISLGMASGCSLVMRAFEKPQHSFYTALWTAPVAVIATVVFTRLWGLNGAALSMVLSYGVGAAAALFLFFLMRRPWLRT